MGVPKRASLSKFFAASLAFQVLSSGHALAFSEDSSAVGGVRKSSVHYDLTVAFGRCLGAAPAIVQAIARFNQATDSGEFQGAVVDFTDRLGPNGAYFHVPQAVEGVVALEQLRTWAVADSPQIPAGLPLPTASVAALAGTPQAFGIYIHALGDSFSHKACTDAGAVPHCGGAFPPCASSEERLYCNTRAHKKEFGRNGVLTENTVAGLTATYQEMAKYFRKDSALTEEVQQFINTFAVTSSAPKRVRLAAGLCQETLP